MTGSQALDFVKKKFSKAELTAVPAAPATRTPIQRAYDRRHA
jgi:hypothetical protein